MSAAVRGSPWSAVADGIVVAVRLTPKGGRDAIDGEARLSDGQTVLAARVRTPPREGEANAALVRLIALIASRFGIVVSQKTAAQLVPVLGAAGGAIINTLFIGHYQDMARGHFIVRRLEKEHGAEPVRLAYEKL